MSKPKIDYERLFRAAKKVADMFPNNMHAVDSDWANKWGWTPEAIKKVEDLKKIVGKTKL